MIICHSYVELHLWVFPVKQYLRFSLPLRAERMILVIECIRSVDRMFAANQSVSAAISGDLHAADWFKVEYA